MIRLLAVGVFLLPRAGLAQEATPIPPPHAPFVAAPRPNTAWVISVKLTNVPERNPADKKAASPVRAPVSISSHRGADVTQITVTWADGTKTDAYVQGDRGIQKSPDGKIVAFQAEDQQYALPVYTQGYQGTAWVNLSGYKQVDPVGKKQAYRYEGHFEVEIEGGPAIQEPLKAWIGVDDGLPLSVVVGPLLYTFGPVAETSDPVELPPDLKAFMARMSKVERAQELLRQATQESRR